MGDDDNRTGSGTSSTVPLARRASSRNPLYSMSPPPLTYPPLNARVDRVSNSLSPSIAVDTSAISGIAAAPFPLLTSLPVGPTTLPVPGQPGLYGQRHLHAPPLELNQLPLPSQDIWQPRKATLRRKSSLESLTANPYPGSFLQLMPFPDHARRTHPAPPDLHSQKNRHQLGLNSDQMYRRSDSSHKHRANHLSWSHFHFQKASRDDLIPRPMPIRSGSEPFNPLVRAETQVMNVDLEHMLHDSAYHLEASIERQMAEGDDTRIDATSPFDSENVLPDGKDTPPVNLVRRLQSSSGATGPSDVERSSSSNDLPLYSPQPRARPHLLSREFGRDNASPSTGNGILPARPVPSLDLVAALDSSKNYRTPNESSRSDPSALPSVPPASRPTEGRPPMSQGAGGHSRLLPSARSPRKTSTPSLGLNAEAEEFKLSSGYLLLPTRYVDPRNPFTLSAPNQRTVGAPYARSPRASAGANSKLNVNAAAFKPRGLQNVVLPSGQFSFSWMRPTPDAGGSGSALTGLPNGGPTAADKPSVTSKSNLSGLGQGKIFDLARVVVADKTTKASPVAHRNRSSSRLFQAQEDATEEDEAGRITQAQSRHKKLRRTGEDGNEAPQFALPSDSPFHTAQADVPEADVDHVDGGASDHAKMYHNVSTPGWEETQSISSAPHEISDGLLKEEDVEVHWQDGSALEPAIGKETQVDSLSVEESPHSSGKPVELKSPQGGSNKPLVNNQEEARKQGHEETEGSSSMATVLDRALASAADHEIVKGESGSPPVSDMADNTTRSDPMETRPFPTLANRNSQPVAQETAPEPNTANGPQQTFPPTQEEKAIVSGPWTMHSSSQTQDTQSKSDEGPSRNIQASPRQLRRPDSGPASLPNLENLSVAVRRSSSDKCSRSPGSGPNISQLRRNSAVIPIGSRRLEPLIIDRTGQPPVTATMTSRRPAYRHMTSESVPASAWERILSPLEEVKFQSPSQFLDGHVDRLFQRLLDHRLQPLEKSLMTIQDSITTMAQQKSDASNHRKDMASSRSDSDADDEEEEGDPTMTTSQRGKSPRRGQKLEQIKSALLQGLEAHTNAVKSLHPASELSDIRQLLSEIKTSTTKVAPPAQEIGLLQSKIERVVASSISSQLDATGISNAASVKELQRLAANLDRILVTAEQNARVQIHMRTVGGDTTELQRQLRVAEAETARQRALAEEKERRLRSLQANHDQSVTKTQTRMASLEEAWEKFQNTVSDLSTEVVLLNSQLREAEVAQQRQQTKLNDANTEKEGLLASVDSLELKLEDSLRANDELRSQYNMREEDLAIATGLVEAERAASLAKDDKFTEMQRTMSDKLDAEIRTKKEMEDQIASLRKEQQEAWKLKIQNEELQKANDNLQMLADQVRLENLDLEKANARYESEVTEAREAACVESQRVKLLMDAEVETARHQADSAKAELESELGRARMDLEYRKLEYESATTRGQIQLEEAIQAKRDALRAAAESEHEAMEKQQRKHEQHIDDLKSHHEEVLEAAVKNQLEKELLSRERVELSESRAAHLQEAMNLLQEKLGIARSAANAAAHAAQQAKAGSAGGEWSGGSSSQRGGSATPSKVSPQALRESILVLQEQLQERESRIEGLEQELQQIDREAPHKVKEQEMEIAWLRELLDLRLGDLEDIIQCLSSAEYNHEAVRDATIRLKANVEMEQQERERMTKNVAMLPSLASIRSLAAPKGMLPLAAAWGNWRKSRGIGSERPGQSVRPRQQQQQQRASSNSSTPVRGSPSSSTGLFSGLMTPPSTHRRAFASTRGGLKASEPASGGDGHHEHDEHEVEGPRTPPRPTGSPFVPSSPNMPMMILDRDQYDQDAQSNHFSNEPDHVPAASGPSSPSPSPSASAIKSQDSPGGNGKNTTVEENND